MNNIIFSVAWIAVTSAALGLATYFNLRLPPLSLGLVDQQLETYLRGLLFALLLMGFFQGSVLSIRERKFFCSWTAVTVLVGSLSVSSSLVSMAAALVSFNPLSLLVGYVISSLLLGLGYSWVLRKLPRSGVMTWMSLGYCVIMLHLIIMSWQVNDEYTPTSPEDWNWVRPVVVEGAIASTIQVAGLLYVLNNKEPVSHSRYQEKASLTRRLSLAKSLHKPIEQAVFFLFWFGGTLLGLSLYLFDPRLIILSPVAIGIVQGLVLSRWFSRFPEWIFFTVVGGSIGGSVQVALFSPLAYTSGNIMLASFVAWSIAGVILGFFHNHVLRGIHKAKQIIWVDALSFGLFISMTTTLTSQYPESSLRLAFAPMADVLAALFSVCAIALQGAGLLHILKSEIVHNREINLQDII